MILTTFLHFQLCRVDIAGGGHFHLVDRYITVREDAIIGYEKFAERGGEQCVMIMLVGGKRRYVKPGPEVMNIINRGWRPR